MNSHRAKIVIVSNLPPPTHGVAVFNVALRAELTRRGTEFKFVRVGATSTHGELRKWRLFKLFRDLAAVVGAVLYLAEARAFGKLRAVLYFTPSQGGPAIIRDYALTLASKPLALRIVAHLHGCAWINASRGSSLSARLMRRSLSKCDRVICLGDTYARTLAEVTGLATVPVNNGLPALETQIASRPLIQGEPVELLFLGSLAPSKGLWPAARSLRILNSHGHLARLVCAGPWRTDQDRIDFETEFSIEVANRQIIIAGLLDEVSKASVLSRSHFLVLPILNTHEGQPLVILEAMRAGVLPICTAPPAIADLLRFPGGEVIASEEHRSPDAIAAFIETMLRDPSIRARLVEASLRHFSEHLRIEKCTDAILATLEST